jgi:glucan phosphoethanolaminetransferase (alkaline phosphatase superfamily)
MNKKKVVLGILLDLAFLIVFNVCFFVIGSTNHTASGWLAYGFIHFAYIMVLLTPVLARKSFPVYIWGLTIAGISTTYFIVEFIVGIIFIVLNHDSIKVDLVVQVIIAGLYLVTLLANMIANETTADNIARNKDEVAFIKNASSRVKALMDKFDDKKANKAVEQVYDLIHSSPSKSCVAAQSYENDVVNKIGELESYVSSNDKGQAVRVAGEIVELMEERNRKVRSAH